MEKFGNLSFYGRENEELQKEYERMFCNMTQEEKQILLKDLCARLPYHTMVLMGDGAIESLINVNVDTYICNGLKGLPKPYLRPMSSMTEEERKYYNSLSILIADGECDVYEEIDWLNAHHFDFRGLIEKGLAIEAPEGMYKTE